MASAEGGWGQVPSDGYPAELHKDEMVLPAPIADSVRNMARAGAPEQASAGSNGASGITIHDSSSTSHSAEFNQENHFHGAGDVATI